MFFLSNKIDAKHYTFIHNAFFEQVVPYIDSKYTAIYMYAYYLASNVDTLGAKSNEDIAKLMNVDVNSILEAFDYLEKLNLIRKHYIENSTFDNYSIEFLPLDKYTSDDKSYEEEYLESKNESLRLMYDKIEEIIKQPLSAYDIRRIDASIKNNNLAYDVVVEAFKFVYYNKKVANINEVIATLKTWVNDGITTSNDLENNLFNINERYATYRKILKYFGEYRLPTRPEAKTMDKWIDDYCFSIEVIEKGIDETLKIKSPNFKYLDSVMVNWHNAYLQNQKIVKANEEDYAVFRRDVLEYMGIASVDTKNDKMLSFMYKNYPKSTVLLAIDYARKEKKKNDVSVEDVFDMLTSSQSTKNIEKETVISFGNITLEDMNAVLDSQPKKTYKKESSNKITTKKSNSYSDKMQMTREELERFMLSKNDLNEF